MKINWTGLADVFRAGLLAGVVVTGLFATGVRLPAAQPGTGSTNTIRSTGAWACFALAVVGVAYGLSVLIQK